MMLDAGLFLFVGHLSFFSPLWFFCGKLGSCSPLQFKKEPWMSQNLIGCGHGCTLSSQFVSWLKKRNYGGLDVTWKLLISRGAEFQMISAGKSTSGGLVLICRLPSRFFGG